MTGYSRNMEDGHLKLQKMDIKRMTRKIRYNGHELIILMRFLGILCLTLVQKVSSACKAHMCLTWKVQNTKLVLICKVDASNFPITFYDPFHNETGFCVPHASCTSLLHKAYITKNNSQHEITVTMPLKMQLNGWWICSYGDNYEKAATEVTIQDVPSNSINGGLECWTLMILWCLSGFVCSYLLFRLVLFVLTYCKCSESLEQDLSEKIESYLDCCQRSRCGQYCHAAVVKKLIVFSLSVTLFVLPFIVGKTEEEHCVAPAAFACYGATVGIVSCLLLINKDQYRVVKPEMV